jgi:VPDSG-CTERM motif
MKTLQITALGAIVALGLTCGAKANIITPLPGNPYTVADQSETTILAAANADGVDGANGDLTVDVRLTSAGTVTNSFGTFTVTQVSTGVEDFSFSLNPGFVLAGLMLHDGAGNIVNFYSINDETSGTNEGPVSTPNNASGSPGGLSNFDFLLETAPNIPDGGTTVMLLGGALAGLGLLRRFLAA